MKKVLILTALALSAFALPSCMKTQTYVGDYQKLTYNGSENYYEFYRGRRTYLFGGMIPLSKGEPNIPPSGNCEIITKQTFVDGLLSGLCDNLFSFQTIQINAVRHDNPTENSNNNYNNNR